MFATQIGWQNNSVDNSQLVESTVKHYIIFNIKLLLCDIKTSKENLEKYY